MMDKTFHFDNSDEFLGRLKELVDQGIDPKKIRENALLSP